MTNTIKIKTLLFSFIFLFAIEAHAQPTFSAVFTPSTIGPGSNSRLTFTITNPSAAPVTGLAFTNVLTTAPGNVNISAAANVTTNCSFGGGGNISALDGGGVITLTDAQLGSDQSCTIEVNVTATTPGVHTNPAVTLSSNVGSSMSLPVDLTVTSALPGFSKNFAPSSISLGAKSTLTFTMDNSLNVARIGSLDFTDLLPVGLVVASPANASTDCISAVSPDTTIIAVPGSGQIILDANGINFAAGFEVLPIGATCTVSVDVLSTGIGVLNNQTSTLLADFVGAGFAIDALDVTTTELSITKAFLNDPIPSADNVVLSFVLTNRNRDFSATGVSFADDLTTMVPALAGLTFDSLISNDCGGSVTGLGGTAIGLTGGSLSPQASCSINVNLTVPAGTTTGAYDNTTGAISASVNGSTIVGNTAVDTLFVEPIPKLTKEFLEVGTFAPNPVVNPGDDVIVRFTVENTSTTSIATDLEFLDELTDGGLNTGFLPFPVIASFPGAACGGSVTLFFIDSDRQGISLTGGSFVAAPAMGSTCSFDVTVTIPIDMPIGVYTNTTGNISATVDGATRIGNPASDDLTIVAAPSLSKAFSDDPVAPGGTVTLEFTLNHSSNATTDATNITFTDDLSTALMGLTANLPVSPTPPCGAGSSLVGSVGDTFLTLMGGSLAAGDSCTFSVTLNVPIAATPGNYNNTTSAVSADVMGLSTNSAAASDVLKVAGVRFTKEFIGDPVIAGDTATLRFTIENIHPTDDATITFFLDNLSTVLPGLTAPGIVTVNTCGGMLTGPTNLIYTGGSVLSGTMCAIEVDVLIPPGTADGSYLNVTSALSVDQGGAFVIDPATDSLEVSSNLLQLTKQFTDDPVAAGDSVTLELTLTNLDMTQAASSIGFSDDLGAVISGFTFDSIISNNCGATVTGMASSMITVANASLLAAGSCTIQLSLTVPAATGASIYTITTSQVTGMIGGLDAFGDAASDDLEVIELLLFSVAFDGPTAATGSAVLTFIITNPGADTVDDFSFMDDLNAVIPGLIATSLPAVPCGMTSNLSGISLLTFTGGSLAPMGGTCNFSVDVLVPVTAMTGSFVNSTSDLTVFGLKYSDPATANLIIFSTPTFTKLFTPDTVDLGLTSVLSFTIDNTANTFDATGLDFTDNLPANMILATPAMASTTCTGGTLTAVDGSTSVSYSGGTASTGASCNISVAVTTSSTGSFVNTSSDLTSSLGNSGTASDTLIVFSPPIYNKLFTPDVIVPNGISQLSFSIDNTNSTISASALDFTDNFPANVIIATPNNANNSCTGGTLTATAGTAILSYTGGTVNASSSCVISVDVTSATAGNYVNTTGDLTSSLGNSGTASDSLLVANLPMFSKTFANNPELVNTANQLTFVIDNSSNTFDVTGLAFTDNLPAGMQVANPANISNSCTGGTFTAVSGSSVIDYSNGTVLSSSMCMLTVDILATAIGGYVNTTMALITDLGTSGTATANLTAIEVPLLTKSFITASINSGNDVELSFEIINNNTIPASVVSFTDDLDAFILGATASNLPQNDVCGVGSTLSGINIINLSNATLAANSSCQFSVMVTVPINTLSDTFINVTNPLNAQVGGLSVVGAVGSEATAGLVVVGIAVVIPLFNNWFSLMLLLIGVLLVSRVFIKQKSFD